MKNFKRIWSDQRGQDLIEYALMAAFVTVAAAAIMPGVVTSVRLIVSKIWAIANAAARGVTWDRSFVLPGEDYVPEVRIGAAVVAALIFVMIVLRRRNEVGR